MNVIYWVTGVRDTTLTILCYVNKACAMFLFTYTKYPYLEVRGTSIKLWDIRSVTISKFDLQHFFFWTEDIWLIGVLGHKSALNKLIIATQVYLEKASWTTGKTLCETLMPSDSTFQWKGLAKRIMPVKYEKSTTHHWKIMANITVFEK